MDVSKDTKNRFWRNTAIYTLLLAGYLLIYVVGVFKTDEGSGSKVDFIYQQF